MNKGIACLRRPAPSLKILKKEASGSGEKNRGLNQAFRPQGLTRDNSRTHTHTLAHRNNAHNHSTTNTHIQPHMNTQATHTHTPTHTGSHRDTHTHRFIQKHTHTHTHTHTHGFTQ